MSHIKNGIAESLFLSSILAPFSIAALTYFVFGRFDEFKKEKRQSRLGASVLQTLEEEISTGLKEMKKMFDEYNDEAPKPLPNKSWLGINTINDDILLRILDVTKNTQIVGFPPSEIRIHTKNYFDMMVYNWNETLKRGEGKSYYKEVYAVYPEATINVLDMLQNTRKLLEADSNKSVFKFLN